MLRYRQLWRDNVSVQLLQIGVVTQFFYVGTTCLFGFCCNNVSCIVSIFVTTRKFCGDRVLSPLNLISCCSFILILRHSLLVLLMFSIATQFLCRDKTFLYSAYLCVATQFVMSRQDLSSLCWNLCRDIGKVCRDLKIPIATWKHLFSLKYVVALDSFIATKSIH